MSKIAVFVDAGYFWVQAVKVIHGTKSARENIVVDYAALRQEVLAQAASQFLSSALLRVYWYDGPGPAGTKSASHLAIEDLDDFKLRLGTRNGAGAQKAVDGLIITDLIGLAQTKAISAALVLSGDADLTPGVIAAQGLGIRVHLLSMGPSTATSPFLRAEVDFKSYWSDAVVQKFASACVETTQKSPELKESKPKISTAKVPQLTEPFTQGKIEASTDPLKDVAAEVFSHRDPSRQIPISGHGLLPSKVDARLLAAGRAKFGRVLTEPERLAIREEFKRLLDLPPNPSEPRKGT